MVKVAAQPRKSTTNQSEQVSDTQSSPSSQSQAVKQNTRDVSASSVSEQNPEERAEVKMSIKQVKKSLNSKSIKKTPKKVAKIVK